MDTLLSYPVPTDEVQRLRELERYGVIGSPSDEHLERIVELAGLIFSVPISVISLVEKDRQWFLSRRGLDANETPREQAFCAHAIVGEGVMVVPDALEDPRFRSNPLVTEPPHIRFYAGAPLCTPDGHNLGTLCVIDRQPRQPSAQQLRQLTLLSELVMREIELRRLARSCPVTGLPTRQTFLSIAEAEIPRVRQQHLPLSLLCIDIDNLRQINNRWGHAAGDRLLRDLVLAGTAPDRLELTSVSPPFRPQLPDLARSIGKARLLQWQAQLKGSEQQLRQSVQPRLWLEVLLLGLLSETAAATAATPAAAPAPMPAPAAPVPAPVPAPAAPVVAAAVAAAAPTPPTPEPTPEPAPAAAGDDHALAAEVLALFDVIEHARALVGLDAGQRRPVGPEGADAGRDDDRPGLDHGAFRRGEPPEATGQRLEPPDLLAQVIDRPEGRRLRLQAHDQLGRLDPGKTRNVVDRLLGIELGTLAADLVEDVDEVALHVEKAQLEHGEQADGARANDQHVSLDRLAHAETICFFR